MPGTWIQHLVEKNAAEFIRILEEGGRLYLCEDGSKLSSEVEYALVLAYRKKYGAEKQEAEQ